MSATDFKDIAEGIQSLVEAVGLCVGACWVYYKFIKKREGHPIIQFEADLNILGRQDGKLLIEVILNIENKGFVRHWINKFTCNVLILKSSDPVTHGSDSINHQLAFSKYNPTNERIEIISKQWYNSKTTPSQTYVDPYQSYVDPGVKQSYTYLTDVPPDTAFISIYSRFYFEDVTDYFQTTQRTFAVPPVV
jgi:hypothetical protein